jgi:hypothetical protein
MRFSELNPLFGRRFPLKNLRGVRYKGELYYNLNFEIELARLRTV